jgi:hypothetical protein
VRKFDADVVPRLDRMALSPSVRAQIAKELPKMAGAQLSSVPLDAGQRERIQQSVNEAFVGGFRVVVIEAAVLALAAAAFGAGIREKIKR